MQKFDKLHLASRKSFFFFLK